MIFPGMDPYLEHPQLWTGFHHTLITYIRDYLRPLVHEPCVARLSAEDPAWADDLIRQAGITSSV